jgi:hypothetical protein
MMHGIMHHHRIYYHYVKELQSRPHPRAAINYQIPTSKPCGLELGN